MKLFTRIKCPHCDEIHIRPPFSRGTKAYQIHCMLCNRKFHVWEARIFRKEKHFLVDVTDTAFVQKRLELCKNKYERHRMAV